MGLSPSMSSSTAAPTGSSTSTSSHPSRPDSDALGSAFRSASAQANAPSATATPLSSTSASDSLGASPSGAASDSASSATTTTANVSGLSPVNLHQGDTIRLPDDGSIPLPQAPENEGSLYQVIALDAGHDRCWIRSWPLTRHGSPVFEISLQQAQCHGAQRPVLQRQSP